jgi:hypothetical protein
VVLLQSHKPIFAFTFSRLNRPQKRLKLKSSYFNKIRDIASIPQTDFRLHIFAVKPSAKTLKAQIFLFTTEKGCKFASLFPFIFPSFWRALM